ncbi:MAG: DUF1549 domain-containing protein, partial [Planctomycetia bacterium]
MKRPLFSTMLGVFGAVAAAGALRAAAPVDPAGAEFFESKVRPILAEHCTSCHGATKQMSGLRLDSLAAMVKGGDAGPAIVPRNAGDSLLVQYTRHDGPVQMPPTAKLPMDKVATLEAWVSMGAPWPETTTFGSTKTGAPTAAEAKRNHWAFQPVAATPVPKPKNAGWVRTNVDAFILEKLEAVGLAPSPEADRFTLLRRLSFDLTGLPPTPEEATAFLTDASPTAYETVVERLLASPAYGERWGRHWLDVARYGDSKGYVFTQERRYPYSYTYRDYVVDAFNRDLPYDRFVMEQIAADQLPSRASPSAAPAGGDDDGSLAALGFLTVGRRFLNDQNEILDDRIDVVT